MEGCLDCLDMGRGGRQSGLVLPQLNMLVFVDSPWGPHPFRGLDEDWVGGIVWQKRKRGERGTMIGK